MRKSLIAWGLALASVAVGIPGVSEARSSKTLHVEVNEKGGDRVSIAVPVGFARAALSLAGKVQIELGTEDVSVKEIRGMWQELRESGRSASVDIKDGNDSVRITNKRGIVLVDVKEAGGDTVKIALPESAVDALFSGDGEELDLGAALGEIGDAHVGDIVRIDRARSASGLPRSDSSRASGALIDDGADSVRIWID